MKILHLFTICFALFFFTNCSDDDTDTTSKQYPIPIKLTSSTNSIEPFEKIDIKFQMTDEDLRSSYDSIVWISNGTWDDGIVTFDPDYNLLDNLRHKKITDYQIGTHMTKVYGYKNGEIASRDSIAFEVKDPTKDFLCMQWNDIKENQNVKFVTGRTPYSYGTYRKGIRLGVLSFAKSDKNKSKYIILDYIPWSSNFEVSKPSISFEEEIEQNAIERKKTHELWHTFITSTYGKSTFVYEGEDISQTNLWSEYNKRFKNSLDNNIYPWISEVHPIEIWDTPTASICLFANKRSWYYVIAEPK